MTEKRSRTEREQEFELNILIESKKIEDEIKKIISTRGRRKIESNIKRLDESLKYLNMYFNEYKRELSK